MKTVAVVTILIVAAAFTAAPADAFISSLISTVTNVVTTTIDTVTTVVTTTVDTVVTVSTFIWDNVLEPTIDVFVESKYEEMLN